MLMHRRYQDHSNCPLCGKHGEKVSHVLRCQDADAIERVIERVEGPFTNILVKHSTDPCIKAAILKILPALRRGEPITAAEFSTEFELNEAIEEQETLGWNNYLLGRWSPKWQKVQAQYFASISSQKTITVLYIGRVFCCYVLPLSRSPSFCSSYSLPYFPHS